MTDSDATQGDNMSPAEFAKLMGAYPQPAENPLPTYGGYMDNSPANFSWVQNNDYFGAEEGHETLHEKGDYRIIAVEDYDVSTGGVFQEREDFDDLMELSDTHGMFTISLQKKVMGGWKTIDAVSGVVPHYGGMEEVALMELGIPNGIVDVETFEAFSIDEDDEGKIHIENKCDDCGKEFRLTQNPYIVGGNRAGAIVYENLDGITGHDYPEYSPYGDLLCKACWKINREEDETFEAPYGGAGSLMDIGKATPLDSFTTSELTTSSAIHGDFDEASLNYSGHQNLEVRAEDEMNAEYFGGHDDFDNMIDTGNQVVYGKFTYTQHTHIKKYKDSPYEDYREHHNECSFDMPIEEFLKRNKKYITIERDIYDAKDAEMEMIEVRAEDEMTNMQVSIGCPSGSTKDFTKIFDVNVRGSDLPYLTSELEDEVKSRVASWNETYDAEMEELTDGVASITNRFGDGVGIIQVDDEDLEDVSVEITDGDGDVVYEGILGDEDTPEIEEDDYYFSEDKKKSSILPMALGIAGAIFAYQPVMDFLARKTKKEEKMAETPELIENPNTGNLDPAQYEEMVVESTGYAVDVIPQVLDGSFMGSRFAALPTDRYVDYNEPGIGAHTDIAMNRDEIYLEPEMAMVQASESVKESQAPGQSPYNSVDGEENRDFDMRVLKETQVISLDPAAKPFIPQSMSGYTGNANTPPSVYDKMFNIGVLGQTPAFVPGSGDIGSSHTGSRSAIPNSLGIAGSVGGPLSDQVNANYTDGTTSMSLAQWAIENTVSQSSDTEAVVIDRSSGAMKRVRRV